MHADSDEARPQPAIARDERLAREERARVERARQGDVDAFAELVRIHQNGVYSLVIRQVRSPELAEEITQDAFVRAWRNLEGFRGDSKFATWLFRIAINLIRDHAQSRSTRARSFETSLENLDRTHGDPRAADPLPDAVLAEAEMAKSFEESLNSLDPMYQEAFVLFHQQGLSMEDVADVLGISRTNAKDRVHRARAMVLRALRSRGVDV
jgi:RNA polymerase sigma-70 factor, ECF subfamily